MSIRTFGNVLHAVLAAGALLAASAPAHAVLGGAPMTTPASATAKTMAPVARAAARPSPSTGSSAPASPAGYTVKQTTLDTGTVVREYIGQDGNVFGIAWNGPRMPELATLFGGNYFTQYTSAVKAQRAERGARGAVPVEQAGLVVRSGGHMGAFAGQAYLQDALPAGVVPDDIR